MKFLSCPEKNVTLLRRKEWLNEIATSHWTLLAIRLSLLIAGLMTDEPLSIVAQKIEKLIDATHAMGGILDDPFMQLSFLTFLSFLY